MKLAWPKLIPGMLVKRYKRFLADVELDSGDIVTAHCPNPGRMTACCDPGSPVYLSYHDNPRRKLGYTWELIRMPASLVGVNTLVPNRLIFESVQAGEVEELSGYDTIRREVKVGDNSRLDLVLERGKARCFVEIKNCTLVEHGVAAFPDAVTSRGLRHLVELQTLVSAGHRCVMFYVIQRMDANLFRPADHIDPKYGRELRRAVRHGVEVIVCDVSIDLCSIALSRRIPYEL